MRADDDEDTRVSDPILQMSEMDPAASAAKKKKKKKKKQADEATGDASAASAGASASDVAAPVNVDQPASAPGVNNAMHAPTGKYVQVAAEAPPPAAAAAAPEGQPVRARYTPEQLAEMRRRLEEQEEADDLRHYTKQINLIFRPVMLCIALVVWWVKVEQENIANVSVGLLFTDSVTTGEAISDGLINALIIIGVVIVVTIIFVVLFVKGYIKFIFGYLIFATGLLLGGTGGLFFWLQCDSLGVPLDYITLIFVCWNFAVVGLVSVFWHTPLLLRQFYLVMVSALLAWSLTKIEEWTTWFLLALLVLWDLFAVLTPCGPLRMLVESSQRQNQEIPALLYSVTMIFFMADVDTRKAAQIDADAAPASSASGSPLLSPAPPTPAGQSGQPPAATPSAQPPTPQRQPQEEDDDEEEERRGLKLGLGDFVFYSVLVARAALADWTTVVACICAVVTGLMSTILLLAIFKRALPALPISLALGIMFYFVTSIVITPYVVNNVTVMVHV